MELLPGNLALENNPHELSIWRKIASILQNEAGILGYRIPAIGISEKEQIPSFILRSEKFGIVLLDVVNTKITRIDDEGTFWYASEEEEIFSRDITISQFNEQIINRLNKDFELFDFKKRELKFPKIRKYLLFPENTREEIAAIWGVGDSTQMINDAIATEEIDDSLANVIFVNRSEFYIEKNKLDKIDSLLENTDRSNQRTKSIKQPKTVSDFIKKSLEYTFKLDETQRRVAMQVPDGPQRIRGLAGTGKTVILSMKAALAHKDFPDYKMLFVFNTQSMYNQIQKYISDYYVKETQENPNWNNLEVLHAWGGRGKEGLYSRTAEKYGVRPKTFFEVKEYKDPLEKVYIDLLEQVRSKLVPVYDIVLIDEAQDFSPALFETIFLLTKEPKRIIWAYDEFQSLRELKIKECEQLFGKNKNGIPNLSESKLQGCYLGGIEKDFVLPNSYRNPRINLMIAHGIGMGLYKPSEIIPIEDAQSWMSRGYKIEQPENKLKFEYNDVVIVERPEEYSRNNLETLLRENGKNEKELVKFQRFDQSHMQLNQVVDDIVSLVTQQMVSPEEIIVINIETKRSEKEFEYLRSQLDRREIKAITPGYIESSDKFKEHGFITLTTAFRAKGNEANVVFILNAQNIVDNTTYRMRNAFFVAATRSRGWCYIYGYGSKSESLRDEIDSILSDYPRFIFTFPRAEDIQRRLELLSADKDLEKVENEIDKILQDKTYRALLIEKLKRGDNEMSKELIQLLDKNENQ